MPEVRIILVFDTDNVEDGDPEVGITKDEIIAYAEDLNLEVARDIVGYRGWRLEEGAEVRG